jgi:hypothetical protein
MNIGRPCAVFLPRSSELVTRFAALSPPERTRAWSAPLSVRYVLDQRGKTPPKMSVLPKVGGQSCCGAGVGSGVLVVSAWR